MKYFIEKFQLYNFSEATRKWFRNYLNYRSQYVSLGSKKSRMHWVKNGVPQGSVMGPLMYSIYINEMPSILENYTECEEDIHDIISEELFPKTA